MKVFVSVGTHPQPFDRLLREVDRLAGRKGWEFFAQAGNSGYRPKNFPFRKFLDEREFQERISEASLVISHGGAGTIINCLRQGKRVLVVPRLRRFGEHTNDHQVDLAEALAAEGKVVAVMEMSGLGRALERAASFRPRIASSRQRLVKRVRDFIESA